MKLLYKRLNTVPAAVTQRIITTLVFGVTFSFKTAPK